MHMVLGKDEEDDELLFPLRGLKILSYNLARKTTREIKVNFPFLERISEFMMLIREKETMKFMI